MRRPALFVAMGWLLMVGTTVTQAETRYWDNNGTTPGFGNAGGTWGTEQKWSTDRTGVAAPDTVTTTTADELVLGTSVAGLSGGTVTVDGSAQGFGQLRFGQASGELTLSGGTLNLSVPMAGFALANDADTVGSALAGAAGISKVGALHYGAFLTSTATTIFRNARLADYDDADGILGGGFVAGGSPWPAEAYYFVNDGTTCTYQLQAVDGSFTKCVKVELTQSGSDIRGRVLYAKYLSGNQLGIDFDSNGSGNSIATSYTANGYGAAETFLVTTREHARFLTATAGILYYDARLTDITGVDGFMGGSSISGGKAEAAPYHFSNDGAVCTYQLQCFNGGYTKCVKIELTQVSTNIQGRVLYAKYYNDVGVSHLGYDFDTGGNANSIATSYTSGGYGAAETYVSFVNETATLRLTGVNTYSGGTRIGGGTLELAGAGKLGGGTYAGTIVNDGRLLCNSWAAQTLSGAISSTGSVVKGEATTYTTRHHGAFLTTTATTIFTGESLADYVDAAGIIGGAYVGSGGSAIAADAYYFSNDGSTCTFQLQILDDVYTKCVKVELTQAGADIAARAVYAKYVSGSQLGFDFDSGGNGGTVATSYGSAGYGAAELTIATYPMSTLTLSAANSYSGGTTVNAGTLLVTTTASALPSSGAITVAHAGELRLNVGSGLGAENLVGVGNGNPITVNSGGTLTLASMWNAGQSRLITVDGGTLVTDALNYLCNLVLRNGAQCTGSQKIRVGYKANAGIVVEGSSACTIGNGLTLVKDVATSLTLDVADVTGDASVDLTISGAIDELSGGYAGLPLIKTGAGTVALSGANTYSGASIISDGTLALGADNTLDADNDVVLNGGALDMGAFGNTLGTLSVDADSELVLGTGQLAFTDSSALTWSGHLSLIGTLGPTTLRFGNDESDLAPAQLHNISIAGSPVDIDANGYLFKASNGTLFQLR